MAVIATALAAFVLGYTWKLGAMVGALAMAGDMISSFIKRRMGMVVSSQAPGLDQVPEALLPLAICAGPLGLQWDGVLILVGVFLMYADDQRKHKYELTKNPGILFALIAAFTVACYTVWDKMAVQHIHPFVYFYSYTFLTSIFYGGVLSFRFKPRQLKHEWIQKKRSIMGVAVLNTFTYLLVLVALGMSKAVYVGALRQVSLVIGVFFGWKILHESVSKLRLIGVLGIISGSLLTLVTK